MGFLHAARQRLLRLHLLVSWSNKAKALAECVDDHKVLDIAAKHVSSLAAVEQELYRIHGELFFGYCPMFDTMTALEVLTTGRWGWG